MRCRWPEALLDGGIDVMELTLRTPAAIDSLLAIRQEVPDMLAGIGTILTPDQVSQVRAAGGAFGVAPGTNRRVVEAARAAGLPFAPGIATPSDLELALELGCAEVKFFPAEATRRSRIPALSGRSLCTPRCAVHSVGRFEAREHGSLSD